MIAPDAYTVREYVETAQYLLRDLGGAGFVALLALLLFTVGWRRWRSPAD